VSSPEHRGLEVDSYYKSFLHRTESATERTMWINDFLAGESEQQVVTSFLGGTEYESEHASNAQFAAGMYADILGRSPSTTELNNVEAQLAAGTTTRAQFIAGYLHSQEAYQLAVQGFYVAYLHRSAIGDPFSAGWVTMLQGGVPLGLVQAEILGDPGGEFYQDGLSSVV
jgi:hypothetical protein